MDAPAPANPFPGLRPFETEESHLFFGRESQSDEQLARLGRHRFLAVVGTSGSGKSSLVRAGLLPSLHGGFMASGAVSWQVACFRPGNDPIGHLARALAEIPGFVPAGGLEASVTSTLRRSGLGLLAAVREARMPPGQSLLVVVDQFEELFRFQQTVDAGRSGDAAAFVKLLLEATAQDEIPIYVVLTMRSDYLGDCARFRDLPERLNDAQYLIPRMTRDQRREAITGPVLVGGGRIAPRLVNRLLNDAGDNPDQLPILQHALMRMWDLWARQGQGGEIDLEHDEAVGGMATALSRHADEAFEELDPRGREIAESLFKSLTEKGPDNREIRRPARLAELAAIAQASTEEVRAVVESFRREGRSFLMPRAGVALQEDTVIDISHESLIRGWQRLKAWVDQEAQSARMYRKVAEDAALHAEGQAALWRDPNLAQALHWREESRPGQAWAERYHPGFQRALSFLDASHQAHLSELARRERGRARLRLLAATLAVALVASGGLAVYAFRQRERAQNELAKRYWSSATSARKESELVKSTYFSGRYLESGRRESRRRVSARNAQLGSQAFLVDAIPMPRPGSDKASSDLPSLAVSEDRKLRLGLGQDGAVRLWRDGSPEVLLDHGQGRVRGGALSPDGSLALIWSDTSDAPASVASYGVPLQPPSSLHLWRTADCAMIPPPKKLRDPSEALKGAVFSADGHRLLVWGGAIARLWNLDDGSAESLEFRQDGAIRGAALSRDGRLALTWGFDPAVQLWSTAGDSPVRFSPLRHREGAVVLGAELSKDGRLILTWSNDGRAWLWSAANSALLAELFHGDSLVSAKLVGDDRVVTWGGKDGARLWNLPGFRSASGDIAADDDFPGKDWPLLIEVATGATVDEETSMERQLSPAEWKERRAAYIEVAAEHLRTCKYPHANLYRKQKRLWDARPAGGPGDSPGRENQPPGRLAREG
jgi:hypothetical protein